MHKIIAGGIWILAVISALQAYGQEAVVSDSQPKVLAENNAVIPVPKLENDFYDWYQRHEQVLSLIKTEQVDLIFIGDSITHMFGGRPPSPIARGAATWNHCQ